uniref:Condensin-2 complex subunit H2 C-terminal domain-containing protein n=1 Tax=Musca domestica TaxID=7370 RepID=A0A1I8MDT7_MUSDO
MANTSSNNLLNDILRSADKHPNSKVSKLIRTVEEDPSQKNIVLLLIELSEHAEYSTDFNISLRYYLDLFERLGIDRDLILNEAGLLLVNSSKIYSKRVDYVQSLVERQILTLSNADQEIQQQKEQNEKEASEETPASQEKPKRGRKRALDAPTDPYEVQLEPKKFKKMTEEKRFATPKTPTKTKSLPRNIEMEQQIHPASWLHATIYDLENEEEVDTKRNYKLFTYHIEHRYNTLVPDINFRLHFKVKDYLDAQAEEDADDVDSAECQRNQEWPPLSEEYVQKYINLENRVLQLELDPTWKSPKRNVETMEMPIGMNDLNTSNIANDVSSINDSGMGTSILESTTNTSRFDNTTASHETSLNNTSLGDLEADKTVDTTQLQENESGLGESLLDQTNNCNETISDAEKSHNEEANTSVAEENENTLSQDKPETGEEATANKESETEKEKANDETATTTQDDAMGTNGETANGAESTEETSTTTVTLSNGVVTAEDKNDCSETAEKQLSNEGNPVENIDNSLINQEEGDKNENQAGTPSAEAEKDTTTNTEDNVQTSGEDSAKDKEGFIELEVHVMDDNDNEPSERLQIQIPTTDDEGVHLSDVYEGDLHMLTPNLPDAMNKDVTIYMDDKLRQALEMPDGVMDNFSQETYTVPVIDQPKEYPLVMNIFKLPSKLVRRKVLFKLGPDMDLYLKARSMKLSRPPPNPREYKLCKNQLQAFSLNNTDMSGILDTPPHSPGHYSEFCGFTDDERDDFDDETTCTDFCGFTEDEQHKLVISPHRLSRDSGVGVDASILTPEKENLATIFEENPAPDVDSCKLNLKSALEKETTEDILNELSDSIRSALEAEIENETTENNKESESASSEVNAEKPGEETEKSTIPLEESGENKSTSAEGEICDNAGENSTENNQEECETISSNKDVQSSAVEETTNIPDKPSDGECDKTNTEENKECQEGTTETVSTANESHVQDETIPGEQENTSFVAEGNDVVDSVAPELEQSMTGDESQEDNALFDLDLQGTKTKIQQWHEHLRPILAKSRERHHFDVFQLGTEIIDTIQSTNCDVAKESTSLKPEASFEDIMDNKDRSYVSRYFLSTLLLANQSNVDIMVKNKSSENPSSWSDIKLKLLSTKRHTVAIEDNIGMISASNKRKSETPVVGEQGPQQLAKKKVKTKSRKIESEEEEEFDDHDNDEDEPLVKLKTTPAKRRSRESPNSPHEKKFKGLTSPASARTVESSTPQQPSKPKEMLIISQEILSPITTELPTTSGRAMAQHQMLEQDNIKTYQDHRKSPVGACA